MTYRGFILTNFGRDHKQRLHHPFGSCCYPARVHRNRPLAVPMVENPETAGKPRDASFNASERQGAHGFRADWFTPVFRLICRQKSRDFEDMLPSEKQLASGILSPKI